jgi:NADPH-dependent curcumin reductase CurA
MTSNRQVWLKSRPNGVPQAENFDMRDSKVPSIAEGEFLVQNHYLSSDPAARGWIADASTYWPRIEIGDTMRAFAVGEVIESRNPRYAVGEKLMGLFGWQEYAAASDKHVNLKIAPGDLPLSLYLGVLGLKGFTADLASSMSASPGRATLSSFRPRRARSDLAWGNSPRSRVAARSA